MALSMYEASVPVFQARLKSLTNVLAKGEANAEDRKIEPAVFLTARLAPDMLSLIKQVQIATDHAKGAPSRLAGRESPRFVDDEQSFAELKARIDKTLDYLDTFTPEDLEGSEARIVEIKTGSRQLSFEGPKYLLNFAMPNFYFHVTSAYAILRHNGVPLGKPDFLSS